MKDLGGGKVRLSLWYARWRDRIIVFDFIVTSIGLPLGIAGTVAYAEIADVTHRFSTNQLIDCRNENLRAEGRAATVAVEIAQARRALARREEDLRNLAKILPSFNTPEIRALARKGIDIDIADLGERIAAYEAERDKNPPLRDCERLYG